MPVRLCHNIKVSPSNQSRVRSNYNTREQIIACKDRLTFDGIYTNVWENRDILKGREVLLFVVGNTIGGDNAFDVGMPRETYCSMSQLEDLVAAGHVLAWHTHSHPDLTTLSYEEAKKEMTPMFPCDDFSFPYGKFNDLLIEIAKELGYERAWSVTQGNNNPYSLKRTYL